MLRSYKIKMLVIKIANFMMTIIRIVYICDDFMEINETLCARENVILEVK